MSMEGQCVELNGNIYCAHNNALYVYNNQTDMWERIEVPIPMNADEWVITSNAIAQDQESIDTRVDRLEERSDQLDLEHLDTSNHLAAVGSQLAKQSMRIRRLEIRDLNTEIRKEKSVDRALIAILFGLVGCALWGQGAFDYLKFLF